ncbi:MAG: glycosyltransferase family 4 protein [Verrucomicrobiota bacterium]
MKRTLIFLTHEFFPFRGGVATYVKELAEATQSIGYDVEVWTNGSPLSALNFSVPYPIRYVGGRAGILKLLSRLAFLDYIYKHREQLNEAFPVYSSYGALFCGMLLSGLRLGTPKEYGIILHGSELLKVEKNPFLRYFCCRFFKNAAFVASTSNHILDRLKESCLGSEVKNTAVVPCAPPEELAHANSNHTVDRDKITILTLARIHKRKGQIEKAQALGKLPPEIRKKILWEIAGTGRTEEYLNQVLKVCREMVVPYQLIGEVSDEQLADVYSRADIYVMSSRSLARSIEGFGITYLEAGLFEVPVVGYRTGGVEEAVIHGKTGILIDEGNVEALSKSLKRLILDPEERNRLGKAGREHALQFTWEKSAKKLCDAAGRSLIKEAVS